MGKIVNLTDEEIGGTPPKGGGTVSPEELGITEAGPANRRAQGGQSPGPKQVSDAELGLETGPIKSVPETKSPTLTALGIPSTNEQLGTPSNAAETASRNKAVDLAVTGQNLANAQRGLGAAAAAGPLAEAGEAGATALGAGKGLARIIGGGVAGGGSTAIAGGSPKEIAAGVATGGAISGVMDFAGKRAAETLYRKFARAGTSGQANKLLVNGTAEVNDVIQRHGLANLKEPLAANDAVKSKIAEITANDKALGDAIATASLAKNKKLVEQATALRADAQKDLRVLNALQPITQRLATAHLTRLTAAEQMRNIAKMAAKRVLPYAAAGYVGHELLK